MFDYVNTGRPMPSSPGTSTTPGRVRGLYFDLTEDPPGPICRTSGEIPAALDDPTGVQQQYAGAYGRFGSGSVRGRTGTPRRADRCRPPVTGGGHGIDVPVVVVLDAARARRGGVVLPGGSGDPDPWHLRAGGTQTSAGTSDPSDSVGHHPPAGPGGGCVRTDAPDLLRLVARHHDRRRWCACWPDGSAPQRWRR